MKNEGKFCRLTLRRPKRITYVCPFAAFNYHNMYYINNFASYRAYIYAKNSDRDKSHVQGKEKSLAGLFLLNFGLNFSLNVDTRGPKGPEPLT